jgi:(p)ppGpp synthase/HD superfamily hydrolase
MVDEGSGLERAIELAVRAHIGLRYPSPESEPYILHPLRVMLAVQGVPAQMTAVLHDVLEDTDVSVERLRAADLPDDVIVAVQALTHRAAHTYEQYIELVAGNRLARQVKLADLADNLANNRRLTRTPEIGERIARYDRAIARLRAG